MADDTKTLDRGQTSIRTRDTSPDSITIDATDTVVVSTSRAFQRISAACPTQEYRDSDPGPEVPGTTNARQFFAVRDLVNTVDEDFANYPPPRTLSSTTTSISGYQGVSRPVSVDPTLWVLANEGVTGSDNQVDTWDTRSTSGLTLTEGGSGKPVYLRSKRVISMKNEVIQQNFFLCGDTSTFQDITATGVFSIGWRGTFDQYDAPVFTVDASLFHTRGSTGRGANLFISGGGSTISFVTWDGTGSITHRCDWNGWGAYYTFTDTVDVVVIGDGVNMRMYVDGVEVGTTGTIVTDAGPHATVANFGKLNNGNLYHIGSVEGIWYDSTDTYGFADVDAIRDFLRAKDPQDNLSILLSGGGLEFNANGELDDDGTDLEILLNLAPDSSYAALQEDLESRSTLLKGQLPFGNSAYDFDGTRDFYRVLNSPLVPVLGEEEDFTLEVSLRLDSLVGTQSIFAQWLEAASNGSFRLSYQGGFRVDLISDGTQPDEVLTTSTGISTGDLHHVVVTREGNTFSLYLDGTLEDSVTDAGTRQLGQHGALIGANSTSGGVYDVSPGNFLDGQVARLTLNGLEVLNVDALFNAYDFSYGQSIQISVGSDENVVNFVDPRISPWLTGASLMTDVGELTGRSESLQVNTSTFYRPTFVENGLNGRPILSFDGSGDYFEWSGVCEAVGNAGGNFTLTALINPTSTSGTDWIFSFNTNVGGNTFLAGYNASTDRFVLFDDASGTVFDSTNTFLPNNWYLITLRHQGLGTPYEFYVDGVLEISEVVSNQVSSSDRYLLGAELDSSTPSDYFLGELAFHAIAASSAPLYKSLFETYALGAFFDGEDLPNAVAVFEADNPGVVYANADPVTAWNDLTSNGNDASQGTPANQPEYVTDALNGLPAIRFTAANSDSLSFAGAVSNGALDELTVLSFAANTSGGTGTVVTTEGATANEGFALGYDGTNRLLYEHGGQTPILTEAYGRTTANAIGARRTGNEADVDRNAKFKADTTLTGFTPTTDLNTRIGGSSNQPYLDGDLFELALFDRALRDEEARGLAYGYNLKYGVYEIAKPAVTNEIFEFDVLQETGYVDGDPVPTLTDQTGTANATQGTLSLQAEYRDSLIAGLPTLYFDGSTFYTSPTVPNTGAGVRTVFLVTCPYRVGAADGVLFSYGPAAGEDFALFVQDNAGGGFLFQWQLSDNVILTDFFRPTLTLEILAITYDGTTLRIYQNGVERINQNLVLNTGSEGITIGDQNLGANTANRYQGWLSYVNVANTTMTEAQVQEYTTYLARRFRIPL
jgi:hypothetical protein